MDGWIVNLHCNFYLYMQAKVQFFCSAFWSKSNQQFSTMSGENYTFHIRKKIYSILGDYKLFLLSICSNYDKVLH